MKRLTDYENQIVNTCHKDYITIDSKPEAYREYRRKWEQNPLNFIVGEAPIHVDLELNSTCNLRCVMCFQSYATPEPKTMKFEDAKEIIKECADIGVYSIKFQIRGEPLLYKKLPEVIAYAKKCGIIETMINTNGTLLTPQLSKELIIAGLDKIIFTVDCLEKEVYESIRIGANFDKVNQSIYILMTLKQLHNRDNPIVRVQWIDHNENKGREQEFIDYWKERVDDVGMNYLVDFDPNYKNTKKN